MKPKDCYPYSRRGLRKDVFYFVLYISLRETPHSIFPTRSRRVVDKNGGSGTGDLDSNASAATFSCVTLASY